jgi:hypothetical protein
MNVHCIAMSDVVRLAINACSASAMRYASSTAHQKHMMAYPTWLAKLWLVREQE